MSQRTQGDDAGCAALFVVLLIVGAVVAAAISLAALVDPFSWMPPIGEIWADCADDYGTSEDECSLAARYDGFWLHTVVNLVYTVTAGVLLLGFAFAVADVRKTRPDRFAGEQAANRYAEARTELLGAAVLVTTVAVIPIIVAAL